MSKKNNSFKKIALILVVVILISFSFPLNTSYGAFTGILTKPVCSFFVGIIDAFNLIMASICVPAGTNWNTVANGLFNNNLVSAAHDVLMSPDKIFTNQTVKNLFYGGVLSHGTQFSACRALPH